MDQNVKRLWVAKLRSGDIAQARGTLQDTNGAMCCLGVLVAVQGHKPYDWYSKSTSNFGILPVSIAAGVSEYDCATLANKNDGTYGETKCTFAEIADYIEVTL
jgi:hypothetical protein